MIFPGSIFGADSVVPGVHSAKAMRKSRGSLSKELYYALFGSRVSTLADGTRQLVNEGKIGGVVNIVSVEPVVTDFRAKGEDLIELNASASVYDWQIVDNAGSLEASYTGITTFLTSGDGTPLVTANGTHIGLGV